jgi:HrpA-like RNA helicase
MSEENTRILFATHGFFVKMISVEKDYLLKWDAVIFDEAHERTADSDILMPIMAKACVTRRPGSFRVVVTSATMDVEACKRVLRNSMVGAPEPALKSIDAVSYPIMHKYEAASWDPDVRGMYFNFNMLLLETVS